MSHVERTSVHLRYGTSAVHSDVQQSGRTTRACATVNTRSRHPEFASKSKRPLEAAATCTLMSADRKVDGLFRQHSRTLRTSGN
jgi:hypothetical protein